MNKSLQDAIEKAKQHPNGLSDVDLEFIYQQGREDAIDECIKFLQNHTTRVFINSDGWECTDNDRDDIIMAYWLDDLEQMKE